MPAAESSTPRSVGFLWFVATVVVLLSPLVGVCVIVLSVVLSGTGWESPDPGSALSYLALLLVPAWGVLIYGVSRVRVAVRTALALGVGASAWSIGFWALVAMVSG